MSAGLEAARCQSVNELRHLAERARAVDDAEHDEWAVWLEEDAARLEAGLEAA
jgi:hypothetical protein